MPTARLIADASAKVGGAVKTPTKITGTIGNATVVGSGGILVNTLRPTIDDELSEHSRNAISNRAVYYAIKGIEINAISTEQIDSLFD